MQTNSLKTKQLEFEVKGIGKTKKEATEQCFLELRNKITQNFDFPIINMSTEFVELISIEKQSKKEAFMYIFSKREITFYNLILKIHVKIDYLSI